MNQHSRIVNRRNFLKTTAGLSLALTIAPDALSLIDDAFADAPAAYTPNVWLTIAPDGIITMVAPAAEMGQGSFTSLPVIIAEELDADWSKVRPVFPSEWDDKKFGNPGYNYTFQTSASASVTGYFTSLRIAGAQARRVLLDAVAAKWGVPGGGRACDRTERGRPQAVGTAHRLWRGRGVCRGARRTAQDLRKRSQADGELPAHRQRHRPGRRAAESQRSSDIRHGCAGARHGLCRGAAIALCGRRAARRRRQPRAQSAGRHRRGEAARGRRRHRHDGR